MQTKLRLSKLIPNMQKRHLCLEMLWGVVKDLQWKRRLGWGADGWVGVYQMRHRQMVFQEEGTVACKVLQREKLQRLLRRISSTRGKVTCRTLWLCKSIPGKWTNVWRTSSAFLHLKFNTSKDTNSEQKKIHFFFNSFFVLPQDRCQRTYRLLS